MNEIGYIQFCGYVLHSWTGTEVVVVQIVQTIGIDFYKMSILFEYSKQYLYSYKG